MSDGAGEVLIGDLSAAADSSGGAAESDDQRALTEALKHLLVLHRLF
jgi:hypothetical protein